MFQRSQLHQHGWHVSVSEQQRSWLCGQNLCAPFLRAVYTVNKSRREHLGELQLVGYPSRMLRMCRMLHADWLVLADLVHLATTPRNGAMRKLLTMYQSTTLDQAAATSLCLGQLTTRECDLTISHLRLGKYLHTHAI